MYVAVGQERPSAAKLAKAKRQEARAIAFSFHTLCTPGEPWTCVVAFKDAAKGQDNSPAMQLCMHEPFKLLQQTSLMEPSSHSASACMPFGQAAALQGCADDTVPAGAPPAISNGQVQNCLFPYSKSRVPRLPCIVSAQDMHGGQSGSASRSQHWAGWSTRLATRLARLRMAALQLVNAARSWAVSGLHTRYNALRKILQQQSAAAPLQLAYVDSPASCASVHWKSLACWPQGKMAAVKPGNVGPSLP